MVREFFGVAWGSRFGGGNGSTAGGSGGQSGTCATRSRQDWRSAGDIRDQRSAFFKNSARSAALMPANLA